MVNRPLIRTKPVAGGGGGTVRAIEYRRGVAEQVQRTAAPSTLHFAGAGAYSVLVTHMTPAQFGANPRWFDGAAWTIAIGAQATSNTTAVAYSQQQIELIANGGAIELGRYHDALGASLFISGIVDDAVTVAIVTMRTGRESPHHPIFVPGNSLIQFRVASTELVFNYFQGLYTTWWPDPLPTFSLMDVARLQLPTVYPNPGAWGPVTSGAGSFVFGAWTDIFNPVTMDCLIPSFTFHVDDTSRPDGDIEFAVGPPGAEVLQARGAITNTGTGSASAGRNVFAKPFQIFAGERLRARWRSRAPGNAPLYGNFQLWPYI